VVFEHLTGGVKKPENNFLKALAGAGPMRIMRILGWGEPLTVVCALAALDVV
jgi:hypothetical protein